MKATLFICSLFLIRCSFAVAQTLTPEQLQADFNRFRTALHEVHPDMYRYTPKATFDSLFNTTAARLNRPMTQHEFYVAMTPLLVALRDGHIKWIPAGQDEHYPFFTDKLFPLRLYVVENRAWVVGNYGNETVLNGAELVQLNGQPISDIIARLLPQMTFADGHTVNGKYHDLNHFFSGYYATFIAATDTHTVQYRIGNEDKTATLASVSLEQIKAYLEQHKPAPQKPFRLTFTENRDGQPTTAILTIERFWDDKKEQDYEDFLKNAFRELKQKGVANLVLDLRNNEGGEEKYGVALYRYLARKPFRYYDHISVRQKKAYSFPAWTPKLYQKFKWLVVRKRGEGYVFTKQAGLTVQKPRSEAFWGNLYVLINGASFSVTTEFAARVHADQRGTFIGQETGGGYVGDNSGIFAITQLPHTKIDLGIGLFGFHMADLPANRKTGQGILPDHVVVPTVEDVLTGHDRALSDALQRIQAGQPAGKTLTQSKN